MAIENVNGYEQQTPVIFRYDPQPKEETEQSENSLEGNGQDAGKKDEIRLSVEGKLAFGDPISKMQTALFVGDLDAFRQAAKDRGWKLYCDPINDIDPDGTIRRAAYIEALVGHYQKMECTIKDYYSNWVPTDDMSKAEREMGTLQQMALSRGGHIRFNDPYALASIGGLKNIHEMDAMARSEAQAKIDALLEEHKSKIPTGR